MKEQKKEHLNKNAHGHRIIALAATIRHDETKEIPSDILGSYTGTAKEQDVPEQDADDL